MKDVAKSQVKVNIALDIADKSREKVKNFTRFI